ncbi:MAG: hypothetical protein ACREQ5_40210, partial [Candidatus Dormibacteria bacterium]
CRIADLIGGPYPRVLESPVTFISSEEANTSTKEPDCAQAEQYLGHDPTMPLNQGLRETIDWMKSIYAI